MTTQTEKNNPVIKFISIGTYFINVNEIDALINDGTDSGHLYGNFEDNCFYSTNSGGIKITDEIRKAFADDFVAVSNKTFIRKSSILAIKHTTGNSGMCEIIYKAGQLKKTLYSVSKHFIKESFKENFNIDF